MKGVVGTMIEYAVYKGENLIAMGTANECAKVMGVKPDTVKYYVTNAYKRKLAKRKYPEKCITAVKLEDEI